MIRYLKVNLNNFAYIHTNCNPIGESFFSFRAIFFMISLVGLHRVWKVASGAHLIGTSQLIICNIRKSCSAIALTYRANFCHVKCVDYFCVSWFGYDKIFFFKLPEVSGRKTLLSLFYDAEEKYRATQTNVADRVSIHSCSYSAVGSQNPMNSRAMNTKHELKETEEKTYKVCFEAAHKPFKVIEVFLSMCRIQLQPVLHSSANCC